MSKVWPSLEDAMQGIYGHPYDSDKPLGKIPPGFWQPICPGWFLQWAMRDEQKQHPRSYMQIYSDAYGDMICGHMPNEWDGTTVTLFTKDDTCGIKRAYTEAPDVSV
jgi:hypothetical protein